MKTIYTLCILVSMNFTVNAQTLYFSDAPFKMAEIPTTEGKTSFSDQGSIYGLYVITGKTLDDYYTPGDITDYPQYRYASHNFGVSVKGTDIYNETVTATVIEQNGALFIYMGIFPFSGGNLDVSAKSWWDALWRDAEKGTMVLKLHSKYKFKFKTEIEVEYTAKYDEDQLKEMFYDARSEASDFYNNFIVKDKEKKDAASGIPDIYTESFSQFSDLAYSDEELSVENIKKYLEVELEAKITILKIGTLHPESSWTVMKNKYGEILNLSSPQMLLIYKNESTGWCHYTMFHILKDYSGGGNYLDPYIKNNTGHQRGRCNCDNIKL